MDLQLGNKVIIVSGGARGIGEAITRMLSEENAIPIIFGKDRGDNIGLVAALVDKGLKADYITVELTDPLQCEEAVRYVYKNMVGLMGLLIMQASMME